MTVIVFKFLTIFSLIILKFQHVFFFLGAVRLHSEQPDSLQNMLLTTVKNFIHMNNNLYLYEHVCILGYIILNPKCKNIYDRCIFIYINIFILSFYIELIVILYVMPKTQNLLKVHFF